MKKILIPAFAIVLTLIMFACGKTGFKQTETGLYYKFHQSNKGNKPSIDNILLIDFAYRYPADSVFYHSNTAPTPAYMRLRPSQYEGDIYEALRMMSKKDSATFIFSATEFFTITAGEPAVPDFINPDDSIYVDIIMHDFFNEEEFALHQQQLREDRLKEQETASQNEQKLLDEYLSSNQIDAKPDEEGLIVIVKQEGDGPKPTPGQTVRVNYTGTLLDGTEFDSSRERDPIEFQLGAGQVIRGWDKGLSKLNVGSKARFIIPSHLAYGDQQRGPVIKPFSTLIFDVELIDAY